MKSEQEASGKRQPQPQQQLRKVGGGVAHDGKPPTTVVPVCNKAEKATIGAEKAAGMRDGEAVEAVGAADPWRHSTISPVSVSSTKQSSEHQRQQRQHGKAQAGRESALVSQTADNARTVDDRGSSALSPAMPPLPSSGSSAAVISSIRSDGTDAGGAAGAGGTGSGAGDHGSVGGESGGAPSGQDLHRPPAASLPATAPPFSSSSSSSSSSTPAAMKGSFPTPSAEGATPSPPSVDALVAAALAVKQRQEEERDRERQQREREGEGVNAGFSASARSSGGEGRVSVNGLTGQGRGQPRSALQFEREWKRACARGEETQLAFLRVSWEEMGKEGAGESAWLEVCEVPW